jgi:hypothetical protein
MSKKYYFAYLVIGLAPFISACQPKVDIEKEKDAIKAVLEEEKKGFFEKNSERMAATWVQKPSSVKMFMGQNEEIDMFGWAKISERDKADLARGWSDYKDMRVDYSDFQFNIYERNAWILFKARWGWTYNGEPGKLEQTRIMALEKFEGKWKITLMAIYNVPSQQQQSEKAAGKGPK